MAAEKDFELLDDYLANRMPVDERAAFEQKIASEPALQHELTFQQTITESLKSARMAELKSMLNNVPVSPVGTSALVTKISLGVAVTAIIGTVLYFGFIDKNQDTSTVTTLPITEKPATPPAEKPSENEQPLIVEEEKEETATAEKSKKKAKVKSLVPVVIEPKIEVFDPTADLEETTDNPDESDILSEDDQISTSDATILVAVDSTSRRHTFHYKLEQDQLTLYGPFEHNLFEVLEFFSERKRTAFLYYKKSYYYIKDADKATALVPVQDPALLNKLRKHRTGNQ